MTDEELKVREKIETATGNGFDLYYTLLKEDLLGSDNPEYVFAVILSTPHIANSDNEIVSHYIDPSYAEQIREKYDQLLSETVIRQTENNPSPDAFYSKLYNAVFCSGVFPDNIEAQTVLLYILTQEMPLIPYYEAVNLMKMDNAEFRSVLNELLPQLQQAIHMLNRHFGSRTEEASQLLEISKQIETERDQIVYWAGLLSIIRKSVEKSVRRALQKSDQ